MTVVDDGTLPGRLPARLRWRYGAAWRGPLGWTAGGVAAIGYGTARGAANGRPVFGAIAGVVVVGGLIAMAVFKRPGVRVTSKAQPELFALVQDVAVRTGVRPPDGIWLVHTPRIEALARPLRRELLIGRAVVPCLTEPELRAVVAHELAILSFRRPRLVTRLIRLWFWARLTTVFDPAPQKLRLADDLRPFAEAVHAVADAAATRAAGHRDVAARAFVRCMFAGAEYGDLATVTAAPPKRQWEAVRVIQDLDDAWRRWLDYGCTVEFGEADGASALEQYVDRQHPALAGAGRSMLGHVLSLAPATPAVPIRPLTSRHERRLARRLRKLPVGLGIRWCTCATAPAHWWSDRARKEADRLRGTVSAVLGRPPVDDFETVDVLINRNAEVVAITDPDDEPDPDIDDGEYVPPPSLCGLVEDALLQRGWQIEHPAIRGVLIGPQGERIDAARSITRTETGLDLDPLLRVLRPTQVGHEADLPFG